MAGLRRIQERVEAGHGFTWINPDTPIRQFQKNLLRFSCVIRVNPWPGCSSSRGDSFYQVFLLTLALGSDGEGVEHAERERILQGFILPVA